MKISILRKQVNIVWLPIVLILSAAVVIVVKLVLIDPVPGNSVLITSADRSKAVNVIAQSAAASVATAVRTATDAANLPTTVSAAPTWTDITSAVAFSEPSPTIELIAVYVSGAVHWPGVYKLTVGARVIDALSAAGGAEPEADLNGVNLAERVSDEEHVLVPHLGDTPVPVLLTPSRQRTATPKPKATQGGKTAVAGQESLPTATVNTPSGKVNINTATVDELDNLPGIGPVLAARIVADRTANGLYRTPEDLMRVPGIKEGLYTKMRDQITVGP